MKKILAVLIFLLPWLVRAQVPQNVKGNGINVPYYDGTQLKAFFTGKNAKPIMGGNGEVLVSEAVAQSGGASGRAFEEIGVVELKGVSEPVRLFRAIRAN